jgi:DNA-binding FrmR family transcriptional regulator
MEKPTKLSCLKRLNRIEGQVRGVARMLEDDRYCIDVLTQLQAVRAALSKVEAEILKDHLGHCIEGAIVAGNASEQRKKASELIALLERAAR